MFIFFWILFSILVGIYARRKRTKGGFSLGFLLSLLLSPLIGFIVVLIKKPDENNLLQMGDAKKCPHCAEMIKKEAIKCRYCGSNVQHDYYGRDI